MHTALLKVKLLSYRHAGANGERRCSSYSVLTSTLDGVSGQHQAPAALYPRGKYPRYPLDRRLVWTQRLEEKSLFCQGWNPGRPVCCQTLYWLSYPSSAYCWRTSLNRHATKTRTSATLSTNVWSSGMRSNHAWTSETISDRVHHNSVPAKYDLPDTWTQSRFDSS
jgi:hypothetical protein